MSHVVLAYPGNERLGAAITARLGGAIVPIEFRNFPDGEIYLRVAGQVAGNVAIVACGLDQPNDKAVGLYLLASTLRDLGARRILLAAPYLGYMRQDRSFRDGEGVSARYFSRFLSSFVDGLATVDPHLHRIRELGQIYTIPTRVVAAAPAMSAWIARHVEAPVLIGPDSESEQWVSQVADGAKCPFVVLEKQRRGDREVEVSLPDLDKLRGKTPVLVDDIISTARTMIAAVGHVVRAGLPAPTCVGVHAIFAGSAHEELLHSGAARVVTCNTVPHMSNAIDVYRDVAEGIGALL